MEQTLADKILLFLNQYSNTADYYDLFQEFTNYTDTVIKQKADELNRLGYIELKREGTFAIAFYRTDRDGLAPYTNVKFPKENKPKKQLKAKITIAGTKVVNNIQKPVAHRLDKPIEELHVIKQIPFTIEDGFHIVRDRARNIVNAFAEQDFKERFKKQTTFSKIGDARSREEKHRIVIVAINNAIHYFETIRIRDSHSSDRLNSQVIPTTQITANNLIQNYGSTIGNQGTISQPPEPKKTSWIQYTVWAFTIVSALIAIYAFGHSEGWW